MRLDDGAGTSDPTSAAKPPTAALTGPTHWACRKLASELGHPSLPPLDLAAIIRQLFKLAH